MTRRHVHLNDGVQEPPDLTHFVVAQNGLFLRKKTDWVDAMVPAGGVDGLKPVKPHARLLLPRLKSTVFAKAVLFFDEVYRQKKVEAAVLLHYSPKHGWDLTVPAQKASGASVDYDAAERLPGYRCVGTMHSHCAMSAFHSGTDTRDEAAQDGVHITIGRLNKFPAFGMDAEVVVNGMRFPLPHEHVIYLSEEPEKKMGLLGSFFAQRDKLYKFPFGVVRDWTVPQEWVDRVEEYTYSYAVHTAPGEGYSFGSPNGGWWDPYQFAGQKGKD